MSNEKSNPTADPQPTIPIDVDLRNPGQFFACCGLLELAHRVWGSESLGWFENTGFFLHAPELSKENANQQLMTVLREVSFRAIDENDSGSPIIVNLAGTCEYRVDWWLKAVHQASLRTWGHNTSYNLLSSLCEEGIRAEDIVSSFGHTAKMTGRLSVDPRSSWTALDAGFSPNDQSFTVATFPMVEFLAGIGLQRNRPVLRKRRWCYTAWKSPLPSQLVPTAGQILPAAKTVSYSFELAQRGQMTRYFTYSIEG